MPVEGNQASGEPTVTTGSDHDAVAMVDTIKFGKWVQMPRDVWERDHSPQAVRLRVGRLLFGPDYSPVGAKLQ